MYDILQLNDMLVPELKELADNLGVKGFKPRNQDDPFHVLSFLNFLHILAYSRL